MTDPNDYIARSDTEYKDTLTEITEKLINTLGGYIHISRGTEGTPVINWIEDYPYESGQYIEFGENLLDFTKENDGGEIATALIPLGAKDENSTTDKRLTIESVNHGVDYVYNQTAVDRYGWIFKTETWDDVTLPENLLTKATARLAEMINQTISIELTAIDLSLMDRSIDSFSLGEYIRIVSEPHGLDDRLLLKKQSIDLLRPDNDKITLGYTYSSFTDTTLSQASSTSNITKKIEIIDNSIKSLSQGVKDTGWIDLPLTEGWSYRQESDKPQLRKIGAVVYLRGVLLATSEALGVITTIPEGYRPLGSDNRFLCALNQTELANIQVNDKGIISDIQKKGASRTFLNLNSISFPVN